MNPELLSRWATAALKFANSCFTVPPPGKVSFSTIDLPDALTFSSNVSSEATCVAGGPAVDQRNGLALVASAYFHWKVDAISSPSSAPALTVQP